MKNSITGIILVFALLGVGGLFFTLKKATTLKQNLITAESKTDSLKKNADLLSADVKTFKDQSDSLATKNKELEKSFAETNLKLASRDRQLWQTKKSTEETSKKYDELLNSKKDWEKQLENLKTANAQLGQENKTLTNKTALLADDNKQLNVQLIAARLISKDNIFTETMAKSGQLKLKGKKVRKIFASFDTPNELKNPTFKIYDPHGTPLPDQYGTFDCKTVKEPSSAGSLVKYEITYSLLKKIGPGRYKIEMLSDNKHAGSLGISFR